MSKSVKIVMAISLLAFVAACAAKTAPVVPAPAPIAAEPTYNKY